MQQGEPQYKNDLFFVCSLIEYIARNTKNTKKYVIEKLGKDTIQKIYDLADVYHSENIEKVCSELVQKSGIEQGEYDIISGCMYSVPSYWDIGRVYQHLILMVNDKQSEYINTLIEVLSSWIILKIDNYNSSMYYENPDYIYACYKEGKIL